MEDTAYCSSDTTELAQALMKVQRNLQPVAKDATNTYIGNRYATLNTVMDACRDLLLENNIWMIQYPVPAPASGGIEALGLVTKLTHVTSGQWQSGLAVAPLPKADPQGYGSCLSYLRRYTLCAMLGIVTEDDDGEGAKKTVKSRAHAPRPENASQREKTPSDESTQGRRQNSAVKSLSTRENFSGLPRIDGISYQTVTATDGRACIVAVGQTQPKKELLMGAGFKWNAQRRMWWKYADAS